MSSFLSKVHYQLFEKMRYQDALNKSLSSILNKPTELKHLPDGDLADLIDHENIHGWLSESIELVEKSYSDLIKQIQNDDLVEIAKSKLFQLGKEASAGLDFEDPLSTFQAMHQFSLDGMPCDRGVSILSKEANELGFEINSDVHHLIEDLSMYYEFKKAWMEGFVSKASLSVFLTNPAQFSIQKEAYNV